MYSPELRRAARTRPAHSIDICWLSGGPIRTLRNSTHPSESVSRAVMLVLVVRRLPRRYLGSSGILQVTPGNVYDLVSVLKSFLLFRELHIPSTPFSARKPGRNLGHSLAAPSCAGHAWTTDLCLCSSSSGSGKFVDPLPSSTWAETIRCIQIVLRAAHSPFKKKKMTAVLCEVCVTGDDRGFDEVPVQIRIHPPVCISTGGKNTQLWLASPFTTSSYTHGFKLRESSHELYDWLACARGIARIRCLCSQIVFTLALLFRFRSQVLNGAWLVVILQPEISTEGSNTGWLNKSTLMAA
ncbi:hypothetical protein DFH06DRAFT_1311606 [Mycena polygramma]|nr:hypothetical protein DFH06DRAFT_1311606 [Mycena polygramma]